MAEKFPLDWPLGYKKTVKRMESKFSEKPPDTVQRLLMGELGRLGARDLVVSSNLPVRKDGGVFTEYLTKKIEEPGIALYFKYKEQDVVICCDQFQYPWENMYALAKGIEAIRGMERWGVSEFMDRAFTGFKAIAEKVESNIAWYQVLGVDERATANEIKVAYRDLAKVHHPDSGGDAGMFDRITRAYNQGIKTAAGR